MVWQEKRQLLTKEEEKVEGEREMEQEAWNGGGGGGEERERGAEEEEEMEEEEDNSFFRTITLFFHFQVNASLQVIILTFDPSKHNTQHITYSIQLFQPFFADN